MKGYENILIGSLFGLIILGTIFTLRYLFK